MNNKWMKWYKLICVAILVGLGAVQVVYALIWAIGNGTNVQDFYDTGVYLAGAETMTCDGWRLIGYSYVLRFFMQFKGLLGDAYVILLYLTQVILSVVCYAMGLRSVVYLLSGKKIVFSQALLPAIYIVTIPIIWQMQFAILPDALCLCLVVLIFAKVSDVFCNYKKNCWDCYLVIAGCFLMLGIMHHHYFYSAFLILVAMGIVLLVRLSIKKYRSVMALFEIGIVTLMLVLFSFVIKEVNADVPRGEVYASYSIEADLWSRFVYPDLQQDYFEYSERVTMAVDYDTVSSCAGIYENYMSSIGPVIEANNPEESLEIYREMVVNGWILHKEEMQEGMVKEIISYLLMPFSMVKYMYYSGISLYGHNYSKMQEITPILTANYMHVSMIGFMVCSLIGCSTFVLLFLKEKKVRCRSILAGLWFAVSVLCVSLPLMILAFARFDYRIGLFSVFVWAGFAIANIYTEVKW